jgi:ribonuclease HII
MIAGVDEAGRGPVIGPLVIALVAVSHEHILDKIALKDSKLCTPPQRELFKTQINQIADKTKILSVSAADIDTMRKTMTLNQLEVYTFSKLISAAKPDICYIDSADVNANRFALNIKKHLDYSPQIISRHKADNIYPVVSAASIIAKTTRDSQVSVIEKELSKTLPLPLGSGYPADPITQKFLKTWLQKYGTLPPHVRLSWKTAQNLVAQHKTKSLDDYS